MKEILALLLAAIMCFSLIACGGGTPNTDDSSTQQNEVQQEAANNEDTDSSTETENNEPQYETVELTLENWNEYFEIADKLEVARNDFGEVWRVQAGFYLQLKPEYSEKCLATEDFAIKIEWKQGYVKGTVNLEDETYEIAQDFSTVSPVYTYAIVINETKQFHASVFDRKEHFFHFPYDFKVTQIKGIIYIQKDV